MPAFNRSCWLLTYPQCDLELSEMQKQLIETFEREDCQVEYMCIASEMHKDGNLHRHIFIKLTKPWNVRRDEMNMFDMVRMRNGELDQWHCNIEAHKFGSPKRMLDYVKKGNDFIEYGLCPYNTKMTKKQKNDLILNGNLSKLVEEGTIDIYRLASLKKSLDVYLQAKQEQEEAIQKEVYWFYGPTGSGKTRKAIEIGEEEGGYWISNDFQWFDGYRGQPVVIFDDLRSGSLRFNFLLRLLDRYRLQVPIKGGFTWWIPRKIIITSPTTPDVVFRNKDTGEQWDHIDQLHRRISKTVEFKCFGEDRQSRNTDSIIYGCAQRDATQLDNDSSLSLFVSEGQGEDK